MQQERKVGFLPTNHRKVKVANGIVRGSQNNILALLVFIKRWGLMSGIFVFAAGMLTGVFMHYTLHRLMLSLEPFIYVVF